MLPDKIPLIEDVENVFTNAVVATRPVLSATGIAPENVFTPVHVLLADQIFAVEFATAVVTN